jgi:Uma2 family endonuclease
MMLMTADEFQDWVLRPENDSKHWELVRGELVEIPLAGERHGLVCANAGFVLMRYARQLGQGYPLCNNPGLIIERDPDTVVGPDLIYFNRSKAYEEMSTGWIEDSPVLAVEVLSWNNHCREVLARAQQFLQSGIRMVWIIDPEGRNVTIRRGEVHPQVFEMDEEMLFEDLLPGFRCRVSDFFHIAGSAAPPSS